MKTLFLHTALKETCVAIFDGDTLLTEKKWHGFMHEFDTLIPRMREMFADAKLDLKDINRGVVCVGPGGFTGVRLGVSTANALVLALNIPFAAVDLFELLGHQYADLKNFCIMIEANREEIFVAGVGTWKALFPEPRLLTISAIVNSVHEDAICVGSLSDVSLQRMPHIRMAHQNRPLTLPWSLLKYSHDSIFPWYYKEPKIT